MSVISTALAKASKPAAPVKRLPFKDHYLKSGLFRVCLISLIVAAPLVTLAVRASTHRPVVTAPKKVVVTDVPEVPVVAAPVAALPAQPKPELSADFHTLPINAIMATGKARVMLGSRIVHVGEDIIPGLKLVQIASDKLIAVDEAGAHYERGF
jgi:hypothetical protein